MIARLAGNIVHQDLDHCVLDVHGVGFQVLTPIGASARFSQEHDGRFVVHIHTSVREDAIQLYGFATQQEREVFTKLISISGVGPKLGLAVLSDLTIAELATAVHHDDLAQLTRISGVGKKTAQRLLLELKSKLADFAHAVSTKVPGDDAAADLVEDLRSALTNLGYKSNQIEEVIDKMGPITEDTNSIEPLLRNALKLL